MNVSLHPRIQKTISVVSFIFPIHPESSRDPFSHKRYETVFCYYKSCLFGGFYRDCLKAEANSSDLKKNSRESFRTAEDSDFTIRISSLGTRSCETSVSSALSVIHLLD